MDSRQPTNSASSAEESRSPVEQGRKEETTGKRPAFALIVVLVLSLMVTVAAGLCTIAGKSLREDEYGYLFGYLALGLGLILLAAGGLGLGVSLGGMAVDRGILPRRRLPLFLGAPVAFLGLLAALYLMAPISAILIMLILSGLGLGYGLGRVSVARRILPKQLLPLFVGGVPAVLLGLLAVLYMIAPLNADHLRLQQAMGKQRFTGVHLAGANLSGVDLSGADLSGADLRGSDLSQAKLGGAKLKSADLAGADLSGADLSGANLKGANLRETNLSKAYLCDTNLTGADLRGADLGGAWLDGSNVSDAFLILANLSGASLWETNLHGADLSQTKLSGAKLESAHLSGAILTGAEVTDAQLTQAASLRGATMPDGSVHE